MLLLLAVVVAAGAPLAFNRLVARNLGPRCQEKLAERYPQLLDFCGCMQSAITETTPYTAAFSLALNDESGVIEGFCRAYQQCIPAVHSRLSPDEAIRFSIHTRKAFGEELGGCKEG